MATSLFSPANKPVARDLLTLLQEAAQEVPEWLLRMASEPGAGGGRGYSGRGKFGGRDYRANAQVRQYRHNGASFPGAHGNRGGMGGGMQRMDAALAA